MDTQTSFKKICFGTATLMLAALNTFAAYTTTIKSGDTDAHAESEFHKVLEDGGTITFEEGSWTINLDNNNHEALGDVTIIGQNETDPNNEWRRGAYEGSFVKSTITLTGYNLKLTDSCSTLTTKNIEWRYRGIEVVDHHQPAFDFNNVLFDISNSTKGDWQKYHIKANDGISGSFYQTTFRGFAMNGVYFNRSLSVNYMPTSQFGKITFDRCRFVPAEEDKTLKGTSAISIDAGNDEFAPTFGLAESEIKYCYFVECRIAVSKGSDITIANNIFDKTVNPSEMIHLEEFSHDITVDGNTANMYGDYEGEFVTLGAKQTSSDITITNNVVEQTGQLTGFVTGAGVTDITINSNEIKNPVAGMKYISFWGGNNLGVRIGTDGVDQPGLGYDYRSINWDLIDAPLEDKEYYIIWGTDNYLTYQDGSVTFVQHSSAPSGDSYKWKFTLIQAGYKTNFFTIQNCSSDNFMLEVLNAPTEVEQPDHYGEKYYYDDNPIPAKALRTYDWYDRKPGFAIFEQDGKYCLLPGGNESMSELKKDGSSAYVYIIENEDTATYNWSLVEAP